MTEPTFAQLFCTLAELDEDLNFLGSEREARVLPKIKAASDYLQKRIGHFLPVTRQLGFNGKDKTRIFLPPFLSVSAISNDGTALVSGDYVKQPTMRHWANGPFSYLDIDADATNLSAWVKDEEGVVITANWGLFDLTRALSATVGAGGQTSNASTLLVSNGAAVSPGMVVKIGSEWELVDSTNANPTNVTTLGAAITDANAQTVTFADGSLVNVGEILRSGLEQMKLRDVSGNTGLVIRGWNNTPKSTHSNGATVAAYRTFNVTRGVNGSTAAAHDAATAIYQQCAPDDINALCRKIAGRMLKDAQGGFSGVVGDPNTGQAQYLYVMPHELDEILNNYYIPVVR